MGGTRVGMAPWFVVAAVAAGAIPVPEVHGQEADSLPEAGLAQDGGAVEPVRVSLLPGLTFPPGVSLGLGLQGSSWPIWMSGQFLVQKTRFEQRTKPWQAQYSPYETRRGAEYAGQLRLGVGRVRGPRIYVLLEQGEGVVAESETWVEDAYSFRGYGLGVGWAFRRVAISIDALLGETSGLGPSPSLHGRGSLSFQYHLLRSSP